MAQSEALDDWVNGIQPSIAGFEGYDYPDGIRLDFAADTLPALVEQARLTLDNADDVLDGDNRDYVLAVMAYLGESLLRIVGGKWDWDDAPGFAGCGRPAVHDARVRDEITQDYWGWPESPVGTPPGLPIIVPDPDLGLSLLSPLHLVLAGIGPKGGDAWVDTHDDWTTAAGAYRGAHPDWVPMETQTPGYGGVPKPPPPSAVLDSWLRQRSDAFGEWTDAYPGTWDFTEESLDRLSALIASTVRSNEVPTPANRKLVEGAAWYYGETMRRGRRLVNWVHLPDSMSPGDSDLVAFTVQCDELNVRSTPYWAITRGLRDESRPLRRVYQRWHK